jgi:exopolysaccharide production protein ExoZ
VNREGGWELPLAPLGAAGVDIFFVLSGFIIWVTTIDQGLSPREFLFRRAVRILPLYWSVTLFVGFMTFALPSLFNTLGFDSYNLICSILFIPAKNIYLREIVPTYVQGWTINYEALFYLMFACAISAPRKYWFGIALFSILGVAALGTLVVVKNAGDPAWFWTRPIILEFAFGLAAGWLFNNTNTWLPPRILIAIAIAGSIALLSTQIENIGYPPNGSYPSRVALWGVPSALLVLSLPCLEKEGYTLRSNSLWALGDASFSIYMTHIMVLPVAGLIWRKTGIGFSGLRGAGFVFSALTMCAITGWIVFRCWEQPFLKFFRRSAKERLGKTLSSTN